MRRRELNFYRPRKTWLQSGYFYFLLLLAISAGFLILTNLDYAKEVTIINEPIVIVSASPTQQFTIAEKIQEGIGLLKNSAPLRYETKNKKSTGELIRKQIALAILNMDTGKVFEQRIWIREDEIKNYKKTGVINPESILSELNSDNYQSSTLIIINWWNSFNTFYEIPDRPELVVIANKYLFPNKYLASFPEKSNGQYTDIIYAPYSKKLHLPELVEAGKNYLDRNIDRAFNELEIGRVLSRADSKTLITNNINKDFIRNIIIIEHVDPDSFNAAADGGRELAERVLVVIGANQNFAYRYTSSPAGASGLAQFIQPTYKNLVAKYPEARLIKDYSAGMANHANAIKAMVLFFDSHKKDIANKVTRPNIIKSLGITEEMLAATYNGGPTRVISSVNKFGLAWFSGQLGISQASKILRQETLNYVKKFQAIKSLDLFANIYAN